MNSPYIIRVADYMLPRPSKKNKVTVLANDVEFLQIISVECDILE